MGWTKPGAANKTVSEKAVVDMIRAVCRQCGGVTEDLLISRIRSLPPAGTRVTYCINCAHHCGDSGFMTCELLGQEVYDTFFCGYGRG